MTNKTKLTKRLTINLVCLALLFVFVGLSWQHLNTNSRYLRGDYKTFYHSLRHQRRIYTHYHYLRLTKPVHFGKKLKRVKASTGTAINLNTPIMNSLLKALVNYSNKLASNTLLWMLMGLLGAALSLALLIKFTEPPSSLRYLLPCLLIFWLSWPSLTNQLYGQVRP